MGFHFILISDISIIFIFYVRGFSFDIFHILKNSIPGCGFNYSPRGSCQENFRTKNSICTRPGKLSDNLLATRETRSLLECAVECLAHPLCFSVNYSEMSNTCELTMATKTSSPNDFSNTETSIYVAMDAC